MTESISADAFQKQHAKGGSKIERELVNQLMRAGIKFEQQFRFHPTRQFKSDFLIEKAILCECEGGTWAKPKLKLTKLGVPYMTKSGHSSGSGIRKDCEKQNEAVLLGYFTLRFTSDMIYDGTALKTIQKVLGIGRSKDYKDGKRR